MNPEETIEAINIMFHFKTANGIKILLDSDGVSKVEAELRRAVLVMRRFRSELAKVPQNKGGDAERFLEAGDRIDRLEQVLREGPLQDNKELISSEVNALLRALGLGP